MQKDVSVHYSSLSIINGQTEIMYTLPDSPEILFNKYVCSTFLEHYRIMNIHSKDLKQLYNQLKAGAKKRNIPFNLSMMDLNELTFPITCPVLGIPLKFNTARPEDDSYSVDRIDSSKGYEPDNIVVVSVRANTLKSNATLDEMQRLVEFYSTFEN